MSTDATQVPETVDEASGSLLHQIQDWVRQNMPWWGMSFTVHTVAIASLLLLGNVALRQAASPELAFGDYEPPPKVPPPVEIARESAYRTEEFKLDKFNTPASVGDLTLQGEPSPPGGNENPTSSVVSELEKTSVNTTGFDILKNSPRPGDGGPSFKPSDLKGTPYSNRPHIFVHGSGGGGGQGGKGIDRPYEHAIGGAVNWLAHHHSGDGSWSLQDFSQECRGVKCGGAASQESRAAATGLALLDFLGAGQTQYGGVKEYAPVVEHGVYWLLSHQRPDGDLSAGADQQMYSHAIATIALCEDYGMTTEIFKRDNKNAKGGDKVLHDAAQKAVNFVVAAQNATTGGWRYHPGEEGDTSVVGWQIMALRSAEIAGLKVPADSFAGAGRWLASVGSGAKGATGSGRGQFAYQPGGAITAPMTAVGLLGTQYLKAGKHDPRVAGGVQYLMANLPEGGNRNVYYWYYASQAMHNMNDANWDVWKRKLKTLLIDSQIRTGCAAGSWDPDMPQRDAWGSAGGRVMVTALSCLTLEVEYRYLPLYKSDRLGAMDQGASPMRD